MKKKINIKVLNENRQAELDTYCPDLEKKIEAEEKSKGPNVHYLKSLRTACQNRDLKRRATATDQDPSSTKSAKRKARQTIVQVMLAEGLSKDNDIWTRYYNEFVKAMAEFQGQNVDVVTGQNPDAIKSAEANDCFSDVFTHVKRTVYIVGTYALVRSVFSAVSGPGFRNAKWAWARTPFMAVSALYGQLKKKVSGPAGGAKINAAAAAALGDGMSDAAAKAKALERMKSTDFFSVDSAKAKGRGALRFGAWAAVISTVGAAILGPDDKGKQSDTSRTLDGIFTFLAVQDWAPKVLLTDQLYSGGEQALPVGSAGLRDNAKDPCTWIAPFFAAMSIAVLRSRSFMNIAPNAGAWAKYGFGGSAQQAKQIDFEKWFAATAKNIGRRVEDGIENFTAYLTKKQDDFTEIFKAQSRTHRLWGEVPDNVQEAYINWARNEVNFQAGLGRSAAGVAPRTPTQRGEQLSDAILAAWGKKNVDDLTDTQLDDFIFFMRSYNDGITEVGKSASQKFHSLNVRRVGVARQKIVDLGTKMKSTVYKWFKAPGIRSSADDTAELGTNEVRLAPKMMADEAAEAVDDAVRASAGHNRAGAAKHAPASAAPRSSEEIAATLESITAGNPNRLLSQCDEAADAVKLQLDDALREAFGTAGTAEAKDVAKKLHSLISYINRNPATRTELLKRIFKRFFPDEVVDDLLRQAGDGTGPMSGAGFETSVIYNNLVKKFGGAPRGTQAAALGKELDDMITVVRRETGELVKNTWIRRFGRGGFDAAFKGGIYQTTVSVITLLTAGGILWGFYDTEKVQFTGGEEGFYYVGSDLVSSGAARLFNSVTGRNSLMQIAEEVKLLEDRALENKNNTPRQRKLAKQKIRESTIKSILTLPEGMDIEELINNRKVPKRFRGRINFWKTLAEKPDTYKDMESSAIYQIYLEGVEGDMQYARDQDGTNPDSLINNMPSKIFSQPEIQSALTFQYGNSARLRSAIDRYVKTAGTMYRGQRIEKLNEIFGYDSAKKYAKDKSFTAVEKATEIVNEKTKAAAIEFDKNFGFSIKGLAIGLTSLTGDERHGEVGFAVENFINALRLLDASKLTNKHITFLNNVKQIIKNPKKEVLSTGNKDRIVDAIDAKLKEREGFESTIQIEELKNMKNNNLSFLQNIVREILKENYGSGYTPYPYHSQVGVEEEEAADFAQDWKDFEMSLVRDESRDTAVALAKILIKDLELFGDVVDLIGKNQSVAAEILKQMRVEEETETSST